MPRTYKVGTDSMVVSEVTKAKGVPPRYHFGILTPGRVTTFTLPEESGTVLEAIVAKAVKHAAASKGGGRGRDSGH